jgi:DNA-binding NarL/FixJ family response regulator
MLSGNVTRELVLEAAQHGIGGFYSKENLSLADLRQRVHELLSGGPAGEPAEDHTKQTTAATQSNPEDSFTGQATDAPAPAAA